MATAYPFVKAQFFDDDGNPLSGGLLYTYVAGSLNPQPTYTTSEGDVENTTPVQLDAAGRADIFLGDGLSYFFVIKDQEGNELWSEDNIAGGGNIAEDAVLLTTDQEVEGIKVWHDTQGFGSGTVDEYSQSVLPAVFGSQNEGDTGIQIVGTGTLAVQMGSTELGANAFLGGIKYDSVGGRIILVRGGQEALIISADTAAFEADTLTLNGVAVVKATDIIPIEHGGTGQTNANAAINVLLPSQAGNSGKSLFTDGSNTSWQATAETGPVFLATPIYVAQDLVISTGASTSSAGWVTFNAQSLLGLDTPPRLVLMDGYWGNEQNFSGDLSQRSFICIRADATKGNQITNIGPNGVAGPNAYPAPYLDTYILGRGMSGDEHDFVSGGTTNGMYPVRNDGTLDYCITYPGFSLKASIRIVGYWA